MSKHGDAWVASDLQAFAIAVKRLSIGFPILFVTLLGSPRNASGIVAEIPTAGLATTSLVVGAVSGIQGTSSDINPSKGSRITVGFLTSFLLIADPDPATFLSGTSVISYPDSLLNLTSVAWFGPFALDPNLPAPPTSSTGFIETGGMFELQPPNSALNVSVVDGGGVTTVQWDAPGGISVDSPGSFNFLGFLFQNTSGSDLIVELDAVSPNLLQNPLQQSLSCIPSGATNPVTCGQNEPIATYRVFIVPEPSTLLLLGTSTGLLCMLRNRRPRARR